MAITYPPLDKANQAKIMKAVKQLSYPLVQSQLNIMTEAMYLLPTIFDVPVSNEMINWTYDQIWALNAEAGAQEQEYTPAGDEGW